MTLPMLAPLILLAAALAMVAVPSLGAERRPRLPERAALAALVLAAAGLARLLIAGPADLRLLEGPLALVLRLDSVSVAMTILVAFIGWTVTRYARVQLDGEPGARDFHAVLLAALAAVLTLVQAGSFAVAVVASVLVGVAVRRLLLFYAARPASRRAATKFALVWHAGDAALVGAAALLALSFGEGGFARLADAAADGLPVAGHAAVALLVLAAVLKTAAFPLHGWLTEVMEAPTPVSALLHAGIVNAGGVLLVRTADLVQASPGAMAALAMIGGFTALFGAAVMLTQSAAKTALAWSTVSQMGFLLLQCGLGLWALALLHVVAHSLYKAHAFLSAGGAVKAVAALPRPGPIAAPSLGAALKAFALALALYALVAGGFAAVAGDKPPQALALGAILVFGVAYLVAQGLADAAPAALTRRTGAAALAAALAYFTLQEAASALWGPTLPAPPDAGPLEWALITLAVLSFGLVALAQTLFPLWSGHPAAAGLRVHLANGFYLNALLDRMIGGFRVARPR